MITVTQPVVISSCCNKAEVSLIILKINFNCTNSEITSQKKKISHRHYIGPLHGRSSPFSTLSRRGLNPIKPVYDPDRPNGRLNLTAGAFNQLDQYTSSPGRRATATQNSLAVVTREHTRVT